MSDSNWRERAQGMRHEPDGTRVGLDPAVWQGQLDSHYTIAMQGTHSAAWGLALQHLVQYGGHRCHTGLFASHIEEAPLSTGLLALDEAEPVGDGLTMNAVRVSAVMYPDVAARQLPMDKIHRAQTARKSNQRAQAAASALTELEALHKLHVVKVEAYALATDKNMLKNNGMRAEQHEASFSNTVADLLDRQTAPDIGYHMKGLIKKRPEVALWGVPMELFGPQDASNYFYLRRPGPPRLRVPHDPTADTYAEAIQDAIGLLHLEQEQMPNVLDMLVSVSRPVRALGARALAARNGS